MHNHSNSLTFLTSLILEPHSELLSSILPIHGITILPCWRDKAVMFLLSKISTILFLINLSCFLLIRLITTVSSLSCWRNNSVYIPQDRHNPEPVIADEFREEEDLIADVIRGGEDLLFLYKDSRSSDTLLAEEFKDSKEELVCFEVEDTPVSESAQWSPLENPLKEKHEIEHCEAPVTNDPTPSESSSPIIRPSTKVIFEGEPESVCHNTIEKNSTKVEINMKDLGENEKLFNIDHTDHSDSEKSLLEDVVQDKESLVGSTLTGESTSKSSIEWRSSTIFRDSETENPFTSSSRRSSSQWESYTVYRKYDEEMIFFDRVSAQKLIETESFRSIKVHPRSISERIVHKLKTNHKNYSRRVNDPYQELESAYVAQICLAWEALNWNYNNFQRMIKRSSKEDKGCPAEIAQQFQEFQVLLQRFIESEPYERGRRPEVFARVRVSSPKLLRVPEFYDDEAKEGTNSTISSAEFLAILGDAIQTFKYFLEADKESPCQKFRAFIKKKPNSAVDPTFLHLLKKVNRKKKLRLKELGGTRKCLIKKELEEQMELEITMGLIDMKVVSRVLRMPDISEEQLHWCEEKMCKVRVRDGKIHRDSSTLFFPAH